MWLSGKRYIKKQSKTNNSGSLEAKHRGGEEGWSESNAEFEKFPISPQIFATLSGERTAGCTRSTAEEEMWKKQ